MAPRQSVDDYVSSIPEAARPRFDELRALVRSLLPEAAETVSHGILGYRLGPGRAKVFISGFRDHVGMYPVPSDEPLQADLAPFRHGKGTLWFALHEPLPQDLIARVVQALVVR